eukprot:evm.model.scf_1038.1 EVM.evm.TU.scf_1038.1   scf_1038:4858-7344(+)
MYELLIANAASSDRLYEISPPHASAPAAKVFPIYDTVKDDGAPLTLHAMAERGRGNDIIRTVDRELDVNINEKDRYGRTPLHWAAEHGHKITAEILIDLGAEVRATENLGRTPIHLAARSTHCELLQSLLEGMEEDERKQVVNMQDNRGITALFLASQK